MRVMDERVGVREIDETIFYIPARDRRRPQRSGGRGG